MLDADACSVYVARAVGNEVHLSGQDVVVDVTDLDLESRLLAGLPIVNVFYDRLGVDRLLAEHVPDDPRLRVSPSVALGVVIRNLVMRHGPIYALGEWAGRYEASAVGLAAADVELLNDDRVGRMLARLFDADRASLLTAWSSTPSRPSTSICRGCTTTRPRSSSPAPTTPPTAIPVAANRPRLPATGSARIIGPT